MYPILTCTCIGSKKKVVYNINIHTEFKIKTHRKYIAITLHDTLSC